MANNKKPPLLGKRSGNEAQNGDDSLLGAAGAARDDASKPAQEFDRGANRETKGANRETKGANRETHDARSRESPVITPRRVSLRAFAPNAITALALCFGLTGVRFAIGEEWEKALVTVVFAGVLDGFDGRIARLLRAQSRFGAELDSLSDVIAFGVAPAVIMYLWSLAAAPRFGWTAALALTVCCALRLARYNSRMEEDTQPHKSAGFLTGIPAPVGAGLAFVPIYLWLITGDSYFRHWYIVMPWVLFIAVLLISNVATYSWFLLRPPRSLRLLATAGVGLFGVALLTAPWYGLLIISLVYVALVPFSMVGYARANRQRAGSSLSGSSLSGSSLSGRGGVLGNFESNEKSGKP